MIRKIDQADFTDTVLRDTTTIVKFEADWCQPCKQITPSVEDLAEKWQDKDCEFVSVNIDEAPTIAQHYSIYGVPTFIAFKLGLPVAEVRSNVNIGNIKDSFGKHIT
jgi:thioredoxin 1